MDRTKKLSLEDIVERAGLADLPEADRRELLCVLRRQLEEQVGWDISATLTDAELDEFDLLYDAGDADDAQRWLASHVPDLRSIVLRNFALLSRMLTARADLIRRTSRPREDESAAPASRGTR